MSALGLSHDQQQAVSRSQQHRIDNMAAMHYAAQAEIAAQIQIASQAHNLLLEVLQACTDDSHIAMGLFERIQSTLVSQRVIKCTYDGSLA